MPIRLILSPSTAASSVLFAGTGGGGRRLDSFALCGMSLEGCAMDVYAGRWREGAVGMRRWIISATLASCCSFTHYYTTLRCAMRFVYAAGAISQP